MWEIRLYACARYSKKGLGSLLGLTYLGFWLWLTSATNDSLNNLVNLEKRGREIKIEHGNLAWDFW